MPDGILPYLNGELLYGDDFTTEEIENWFADETEAYAELGAKAEAKYKYVYHRLNYIHAFRYIRQHTFREALGIGSAYGDEIKPIAAKIRQIVILDPSNSFSAVRDICRTPCSYKKPMPDGNIPFVSNRFDLITSLGVMHHIPNVSHVMGECFRCLDSSGVMLLREPITSMGDWRRPRQGLTKRERGIPLHIMDEIVLRTGFTIIHRSLCIFPVIPKLANILGVAAYNSAVLTAVDAVLSSVFSKNIKYHRTKIYEKFAPASVYYVLMKQGLGQTMHKKASAALVQKHLHITEQSRFQ